MAKTVVFEWYVIASSDPYPTNPLPDGTYKNLDPDGTDTGEYSLSDNVADAAITRGFGHLKTP